jgi:hypothetical protein
MKTQMMKVMKKIRKEMKRSSKRIVEDEQNMLSGKKQSGSQVRMISLLSFMI